MGLPTLICFVRAATATPGPVSRASSVASSAAPGTPLYYFYRVISYLLLKTKQIVWQLIQLFWRFLELHLHKISMLVIFVVVVSEVSAGYWVLLIVALLAIPLPYISPILYPLLTSYVGILSVVKTVYQFPIIKPDMFNLTTYNSTDDNTQCYEPLVCMYKCIRTYMYMQRLCVECYLHILSTLRCIPMFNCRILHHTWVTIVG